MSYKQNFSCQICLDKFDLLQKIPRILGNCGHTLCQQCLGELIDSTRKKHQEFDRWGVKCPFDQTIHLIDSKTKSCDFPKNFVITDLLREKETKGVVQLFESNRNLKKVESKDSEIDFTILDKTQMDSKNKKKQPDFSEIFQTNLQESYIFKKGHDIQNFSDMSMDELEPFLKQNETDYFKLDNLREFLKKNVPQQQNEQNNQQIFQKKENEENTKQTQSSDVRNLQKIKQSNFRNYEELFQQLQNAKLNNDQNIGGIKQLQQKNNQALPIKESKRKLLKPKYAKMNTQIKTENQQNLAKPVMSLNDVNNINDISYIKDRSHMYGQQVRLSIHYDRFDNNKNRTRVSISATPDKKKQSIDQNGQLSNSQVLQNIYQKQNNASLSTLQTQEGNKNISLYEKLFQDQSQQNIKNNYQALQSTQNIQKLDNKFINNVSKYNFPSERKIYLNPKFNKRVSSGTQRYVVSRRETQPQTTSSYVFRKLQLNQFIQIYFNILFFYFLLLEVYIIQKYHFNFLKDLKSENLNLKNCYLIFDWNLNNVRSKRKIEFSCLYKYKK